MIYVINQDQSAEYNIDYFHIREDKNYNICFIVGLARLNLKETKLVQLGMYSTYKQAIDTFAEIDYQDNDLFYYKTNKKIFYMPENMVNGVVTYIDYNYDLIKHVYRNTYKFVIGRTSYIEDHCLHIRTNTQVINNVIVIAEGDIYL